MGALFFISLFVAVMGLIVLIGKAFLKKPVKNTALCILAAVGVAFVAMIIGVNTDPAVPAATLKVATDTVSGQTTVAATKAVGTSTSVIKASTATPTTLSDSERRAQYAEADYLAIARNPDDYKGKNVKFTGTVIQVGEDTKNPIYRIEQNSDSDLVWYVNYTRTGTSPRILEKDTVTVYGTISGLITYKTVLGSSKSIPGISTVDIVIN